MSRTARAISNADSTLGSGLESGIVLVLFAGGGFLLDRWLGTVPVFTLILFALGAVGLFYRYKATYTAQMEAHEAQRRRPVEAEPAREDDS